MVLVKELSAGLRLELGKAFEFRSTYFAVFAVIVILQAYALQKMQASDPEYFTELIGDPEGLGVRITIVIVSGMRVAGLPLILLGALIIARDSTGDMALLSRLVNSSMRISVASKLLLAFFMGFAVSFVAVVLGAVVFGVVISGQSGILPQIYFPWGSMMMISLGGGVVCLLSAAIFRVFKRRGIAVGIVVFIFITVPVASMYFSPDRRSSGSFDFSPLSIAVDSTLVLLRGPGGF